MSASLNARTKGKVAQYGIDGVVAGGTVKPRDSGSILGTVPPGQPGLKLVDGTIQRAADLTVDGTAGVTGNALVPTSGVGAVPTVNSAQLASNGLSLAPEHE